MTKKFIIKVLIFNILFTPLEAKSKFIINNTFSFLDIENKDININNKAQYSGLNYGLSYYNNNYYISYLTNKFIEKNNKSKGNLKINNDLVNINTKITSHNISLKKIIDRSYFIGIILSYNTIYSNIKNSTINNNIKYNGLAYGILIGKVFSKNIAVNTGFAFPSKKLDLNKAVFINLSYSF